MSAPDASNGRSRPRLLLPCLAVFCAALAVRVALAYSRPIPVSADAAYYMHVAENLHSGRGFVADYVWNYLAGIPEGLPVPSNGYWMPGTSLVMAGAFAAAGEVSLRAAQWPSLIFGALLCAVCAWVAGSLTGRRDAALLAGGGAAVNYYLVELSLFPDHFMLNATLVNLSILALWAAWRGLPLVAMAAGAVAALSYLTRSDGGLLAIVVLILAVFLARRARKGHALRLAIAFIIAFAVIAAPWWVRQTVTFGSPSGANALRTAFLTEYNDLFRLDQSHLTLDNYLESSQVVAVGMKLYALYRSTRVLLKALMLVAVLAVAALCLRGVRREATPWLVYVPIALLIPCLVVPYPTLKGTGWHLLPSLMPGLLVLGAAAAAHLHDRARLRRLAPLAWLLIAVAFLSPCIWWLAPPPDARRAVEPLYPIEAADAVRALGPDPAPVLTDSAWGLNHIAGVPCAQFPTDGPEAALTVADAIGAGYVITRSDKTHAFPALVSMRNIADHPRFEPLTRYRGADTAILVYRIQPSVADRDQ